MIGKVESSLVLNSIKKYEKVPKKLSKSRGIHIANPDSKKIKKYLEDQPRTIKTTSKKNEK